MLVPGERRRVMQACWVVPDLHAACRQWTEAMGIGPFYVFDDLKLETVSYRGKPTSVHFSVAMAQAGDLQIELAEQKSSAPYAYTDLFPKGQSGFHHIAIYVSDYAAAMMHFTDKGFRPSVEGLFGDMHFSYVDTSAALGCMVEIIEHNPLQDQIFARVKAGAESWDGVTDPVRTGMPT
jgi:Glyoxalase/Bleomycin resistance protein/Dioxygenase superfamily